MVEAISATDGLENKVIVISLSNFSQMIQCCIKTLNVVRNILLHFREENPVCLDPAASLACSLPPMQHREERVQLLYIVVPIFYWKYSVEWHLICHCEGCVQMHTEWMCLLGRTGYTSACLFLQLTGYCKFCGQYVIGKKQIEFKTNKINVATKSKHVVSHLTEQKYVVVTLY